MNQLSAALSGLDRWQQRHRLPGFGYAVVKKFSDDSAGNLAALLAYYAFFSIFPLLLVLVSVLGLLLHGNPHLQSEVLDSSLKDFPVIGQQLRANTHSLGRSGLGLVVGIVGTLIGARGVANAAQSAFTTVWQVPYRDRAHFPFNQLRSLAIIVVFGGGLLISATLQTVLSGLHLHGVEVGIGFKVVGYVVSTVLNLIVFVAGFRLALPGVVRLADFLRGALLAGVIWELLEGIGSYVLSHELASASNVYGTFALVIGLLSWFYLQAQLTLYAVEIDSVRALGLWPRSLREPLTDGDRAALSSYARTQARRTEQRIEVTFDPNPDPGTIPDPDPGTIPGPDTGTDPDTGTGTGTHTDTGTHTGTGTDPDAGSATDVGGGGGEPAAGVADATAGQRRWRA